MKSFPFYPVDPRVPLWDLEPHFETINTILLCCILSVGFILPTLKTFKWCVGWKSPDNKNPVSRICTVDPWSNMKATQSGAGVKRWMHRRSRSPEWQVLSWLHADTKALGASLLPSSCENLQAATARANSGEDNWMETPPQRSQQDRFYGCHPLRPLSTGCTDSCTALFPQTEWDLISSEESFYSKMWKLSEIVVVWTGRRACVCLSACLAVDSHLFLHQLFWGCVPTL